MKSPCKKCNLWKNKFPRCIEGCKEISKFQIYLVTNYQTQKTNIQYDETENLTVNA